MLCILCLQELTSTNKSREHVIPEALGGRLITDRLCKSCNSHLGTYVDKHLVDHWYIKAERMYAGLKGKKGRTPNPFVYSTMADDPEQKVIYKVNKDGTPGRIIVENKVKKTPDENGNIEYAISVDKSRINELPGIVNRILAKHGKEPWTKKKILEKAVPSRTENPKVNYNIKIDMDKFRRGLLKIAYEATFLLLGETYLEDDTAKKIRNVLMQKDIDGYFSESTDIKGSVTLYKSETDEREKHIVFEFWNPQPKDHMISLSHTTMGIQCAVRIFETFMGVFYTSENAELYKRFPTQCILINPRNGKMKNITLSERLDEIFERRKK